MKKINLKIPLNKVDEFCDFLILYKIETIAMWSVEEFFNSKLCIVLYIKQSDGITSEEKERLIIEYYGNYIHKKLKTD